LRLKRLYDAIEAGVASLDDPALLESSAHRTITPQIVQKFARTARERMRIEGGGYRRDHLRALAQRVEVADSEVRIMGSKSELLRTLAGAPGAKPATPGVPSSVLKWRRGWDSNPRYACTHNGFRDRPDRPLRHLSEGAAYTGRQVAGQMVLGR
jgi:site-specific DNA recombinase